MKSAQQREEALFAAALQRAPSERAAFLDRACHGDRALRQRLDALLAAHEQPDALLATTPEPPARPTIKLNLDDVRDEAAGTTIGRYKVLERLGQGGCGVVYMAEQTEPIRRRVALKVIKLGMDTKSVIARFEAERQALALMDHPNIAKVLDAGATDSGRPYFVMELVRGIKVTDYCHQHQLSTRQRIDLFIQICQAVQHAHQKGVIHRDLKPSNILVTSADGVPVPKVIDFGIAKATNQQPLTDKTLFTAFAQFIGTPAYMSPEQAEMSALDIDTRSDIYSLGVLLYELLTGQPPFAPETLLSAGLDEMRRIIRETEPPMPSTRIETELTKNPQSTVPHTEVKDVRGDLDWIVMKCLEKDRTRRYETANGLAADLKRHLENEPVEARPPRVAYRLQKALRRHKLVFTAGAAVAAALVVGITVAAWQAIIATRARSAAQAAQQEEKQERLRADAKAAEARAREVEAMQERDRADANARRFGRDLYVADMRLAQQAWEDARIPRMQELLNGQRPERTAGVDLRGFEWYYWQRLVHSDLYTVQDGTGCGVAFSPDGKRLATAGYNRKLKIRDANTGKELLSLDGHKGSTVWAVAFSPNGTRLASATGEFGSSADIGELKIWDSRTGEEILNLKGHPSSVTSLAFSPDGKLLASSGGDRTVKLWNTTTGQEFLNLTVGTAAANCVAFSPDGKRLASASESDNFKPGEVRVWDTTTGKPVFSCKGPWRVFSVAFSPDGRLLAAGSSEGVKIWNAANGEEAPPLKDSSTAPSRGLAFSSDSRLLAAGYGRIVKMWDTATGWEKASYRGPSQSVLSVALSPDGRRLAAGDAWNVKVWDANGSQEALTVKSAKSLAVSCSPDGQRLATACWSGAVRILDVATGREIMSLQIPVPGSNRPIAKCIAFSSDGQLLAAGGDDKTVRIWDATTGREVLTLPEHAGKINGVAFSPDGTRVATACGESEQKSRGKVKIWDAATGRELLSPVVPNRDRNRPYFTSVAFSPDGKLLAAGATQHVRANGEYVAGETLIWDAATGQVKFALADTHHVNNVAFSPDSRRLTSACLSGTLKVWDTTTGQEICTLKGHTADINSVAFSPEGNRIASAADDATVRLWDAATGQEVLILKGHSDRVYGVAFSPDGKRLASVSQEGTLKIWEAATPGQVKAWQKEEQAAAR